MAKSNIFKELTPEKKAQLKASRLAGRAELSLAYQLGYYVGEQIVDKYLPTLSCDMLQTRKVISVTVAEGDECKRLNNVWFNKIYENKDKIRAESKEKNDGKKDWVIDNEARDATKKEWEELRAYHEMLEDKYLPKTIECKFHVLNVTEENMEEFKKGVGVALWDCDCSHYECDPEKISVIADEDGWFTTITLVKG